jgi:hypothetical protein
MHGLERIAAERKRQTEVEGWTQNHDDQHDNGEMALAAVAYASPLPVKVQGMVASDSDCGCREAACPHTSPFGKKKWIDPWPWDAEWDKRKKHDRIRQLEIAGALIAAEIDRLERMERKSLRRAGISFGGPATTGEVTAG